MTRIQLPFPRAGVDSLSALFDVPRGETRASAILLANGAGFHMEAPFMAQVAEGLAARGFPTLRFNYAYKERQVREGKTRPPDPMPVLEAAHATALAALADRCEGRRILLAGKSLGGRVSSHLAAKDHPCSGLILLGYPLHPPRRPEKLRSEHFAAIAQPALFLQGTRDSLCDLELLETALQRYGGHATLARIQDADHGFQVLKRTGRSAEEVLQDLLDRIAAWEAATFPS